MKTKKMTNREKAIVGYKKGIVSAGLRESLKSFVFSKAHKTKLMKVLAKMRFMKRQIGRTKAAIKAS